MSKLYIIGNGFDLHHGIKTQYSDFRDYLKLNHENLLETMDLYYYIEDNSLLWWEFENGLKDFDPTVLEDNFKEFLPDIGSDEFRDGDWFELEVHIENELEPLRVELQTAFNEWIKQRKIPININDNKIELPVDAKYLTFNYTDILESIYKISPDNITYIHNKAGADEDLLYGHAWNPDEWSKRREEIMPEGLSEEERQDWIDRQAAKYHLSIDRGYQAIDHFFSNIYKDCSTNIINHQTFFSNLSNIDEVYILGHSLSEVDKKYFEKIVGELDLNKTKWNVSYYSSNEKIHHKEFIENLGIDSVKIKMIQISDLKIIK